MASPRPPPQPPHPPQPPDSPPPDAPPPPPADTVQIVHPPSAAANDIAHDQCYVRNSSFLSRDIEAQKAKIDNEKTTPPKNIPPPRKSSLLKENSVTSQSSNSPKKTPSPPDTQKSSPPKDNVVNKINHLIQAKNDASKMQNDITSPPISRVTSPPVKKIFSPPASSPPQTKSIISPPASKVTSPPVTKLTSPPVNTFKFSRMDSKNEDTMNSIKVKKETALTKEVPIKSDKLSLTASEITNKVIDGETNCNKSEEGDIKIAQAGESNGVGDKIRKFEKAAEDASANAGKLSRPGSVRGRARTDRLGSDSKEDLPPPATPFKDHVFFDLGSTDKNVPEPPVSNIETERPAPTKGLVNSAAAKWQRDSDEKIQKPEPQKIIKPEFKPMPSPADATIRSPSLGAKLPDQFPSHGTAFRNVASAPPPEDLNHFKCKLKNKEKYSVSKGSSYFTRGSEEIWLVKKKDIEEIEERVLDSLRRAGGAEHATMGRTKRQMYARSESLDPQWGARAHTLKRQASVACTCHHDKKTRAKSADPAPPPPAAATPRPRSRSHADDNQAHVLDKYETLV